MMIHLDLPQDLAKKLLVEVDLGRHTTIEEVILEKLSRTDDWEFTSLTVADAAWMRRDLEDAWVNRKSAVDGKKIFSQLAERSTSLRAQGK